MTSTATFANTNARPTSIPMPQFISQPTHVGQPEIPPLPQGVARPPPGAPQIAIRQPPNPLGDKKGWRPFPLIKKHNEKIDSIITKVGRVGFIARGFIWAAIGGVALSTVASGGRLRPQSQTGALDAVADAAGGDWFLAIATIGIFFYALWRTAEFLWGIRIKKDMSKPMIAISAYLTPFCSLIFYGIFAYSNVHEIIYNRRQGGQGTFWQRLADLDNAGGKFFLTFVAILLIAVGIGWIAQIIKGDIVGDTMNWEMINKDPKWVKVLLLITGNVGTIGRSFLFGLVGALLIRMAFRGWKDPNGTFGSALAQLDLGTTGRAFLAIEGVLLITFGVWSVLNARYKQFLPYKAHLISKDSHAKAEAKIAEKLGPKVGPRWLGAVAWVRKDRTEYETAQAQGKTDKDNEQYLENQRQRDMEAQYSPSVRRNTPTIRKKQEPSPSEQS
eukprot:TRINITY_DN1017_c0_g1_i1.p1 TRINITY_DN1017_c0_g1~~TRINITY_DN1017_c0_g1_i1.p1  ORF type:complete len:444 (-),score=101.48 TRINITY_DN1017_c0_g1_i1:115-1446(-)